MASISDKLLLAFLMSPSQMHNKIVTIIIPGDMDSSLENATVSLSRSSLESGFTDNGRENTIRSSSDLLQCFKDCDW